MSIEIFSVILIIILFFLGLFLILIFSKKSNIDPINPNKCIRPISSLIDIKDKQCCYINGKVTPFRYLLEIDSVVSPEPVFYLNACSNFCKDRLISSDRKKCKFGNSEKFIKCINLTKPINCNGSAMPVAILGNEFFYIKSSTKANCECSGKCDGTSFC